MVMEAHLLRFVERVRSLSDNDSTGDQLISTEFNVSPTLLHDLLCYIFLSIYYLSGNNISVQIRLHSIL